MLYRACDFEVEKYIKSIGLQSRKRGNQKRRDTDFRYKDIICAFDIETTLHPVGGHNAGTQSKPRMIDDYVGIMYIWQMQLGLDVTVYGRAWDEFTAFMSRISSSLTPVEKLCIYVHNLSYEFAWLRDEKILGDVLDEESVFLVKPRTVAKFECFGGRIEFRCSYLHSNMSLDEYTDKMQVEHGKLSGDEYDYSKRRYSWTSMTDREMAYCTHDVQGLVECLYKECEVDGDNLYTIPLTSTGYVRRDIKKALHQLPRGFIQKQLPDYKQYKLLREAFRGGNVHASRFYAEKRVDAKVTCRDVASSYPYSLLTQKYPITPFREIDADCLTKDHIVDLISKGRAVVARIGLYGVRLADEYWPVPYIPFDKCRSVLNQVSDNGRILSADYLEITVTDIDLRIILDEYEFDDMEVFDAQFASYGYLPQEVKAVIMEYYRLKTDLKGIEDQAIYYVKAKNKLNSIYGMSAQNPVKLEIAYKNGQFVEGVRLHKDKAFISREDAESAMLDILEIAHGENIEKSTMPYQWGVWCTAHSRALLERAIRTCGDMHFLYCDTDSVYYWGDADFKPLNKEIEALSRKQNAYAVDRKGKAHYMGVLEEDKTMDCFLTLGAKKYAYMQDGKLKITIAGVGKKKGAEELEAYARKHGLRDGLDALREGFIFSEAGGTESVYNDEPCTLLIDGHGVYCPTNIAIKPSTYKTSIGRDYRTLLNMLLDNYLFDLYRKNLAGEQLPAIESI